MRSRSALGLPHVVAQQDDLIVTRPGGGGPLDDVHVAVDTTTETTESLPELSSGKAAVNEQVSAQVVEAPATKATAAVTEESSNNAPVLNPAGDPSVEVPDVEPASDEDALPHTIPLDDYSSENSSVSDAAPTVTVVEPRTLDIAKAMLKADHDELMDSGLDFSSAIDEIDLMVELERYGEFGKR